MPVGHDFPPFSANKGGSGEGSQAVPADVRPRVPVAGADSRARIRRPAAARSRHERRSAAAVHRAAEAAAAAMGDSAGAAVQPAAVARARRHVRRIARRLAIQPRPARSARSGTAAPPPMTHCQVINHTTGGYALRQIDSAPGLAAHRRPHRAARRRPAGTAGRDGALVPQHAERQRCSSSAANCCPRSPRRRRPRRRTQRRATCCRWSCCPKKTRCGLTAAAAAARRTGRRVRARAGGEPAPRQRDRLRRAHQARRAGPGLRALRIRRGHTDASACRSLAIAGTLALLRARSAVGARARAACAARLVARAEGAAARAAGCRACCAAIAARGNGLRCCCRSMSPKRSPVRSSKQGGMRGRGRARACVVATATFVALLAWFRAESLRHRKHDSLDDA